MESFELESYGRTYLNNFYDTEGIFYMNSHEVLAEVNRLYFGGIQKFARDTEKKMSGNETAQKIFSK